MPINFRYIPGMRYIMLMLTNTLKFISNVEKFQKICYFVEFGKSHRTAAEGLFRKIIQIETFHYKTLFYIQRIVRISWPSLVESSLSIVLSGKFQRTSLVYDGM